MLDSGARRGQSYARRANSEDSIEVLSTTESIFPEDLTAISEEEAEQQQDFQRNSPQHELLQEEVVHLHTLQTPARGEVPPEEEEVEQLEEEVEEQVEEQLEEEEKPAAMTEAAPGK